MSVSLPMARFKQADQYNNNWSAVLTDDQSFEDALQPGFWAHNARFLKAGDIIRILPERSEYFAEVIVVGVGQAFAKVKMLRHVPLTDGEEDEVASVENQDIAVKWRGPHAKYCVERLSDKVRLKEGFEAKEQADRWRADHIAAMAR